MLKQNQVVFLFLLLAVPVTSQTGGTFTMTQAVISNGGGTTSGGVFSVLGTTGQTAVGIDPSGNQFGLHGGFWSPANSPTAANVSIGGRVSTPSDQGITNVEMTLTDSRGRTRRVQTGSFGYYRFDELNAGETYVLTVKSKRFAFAETTRIFVAMDSMAEMDFTAFAEVRRMP